MLRPTNANADNRPVPRLLEDHGQDGGIDGPAQFFSDPFDMGDTPFSYTSHFEFPSGTTPPGSSPGYPNINDEIPFVTSASSASFVAPQNAFGLYEDPDITIQDGTDYDFADVHNDPSAYYDSALPGDDKIRALAAPPSITASKSNTRSSHSRSTDSFVSPSNPRSANTSSSFSVPAQSPKKRRGRKPKIVADEEEEDDKRNRFLEKNRVAASKCRQRKKEYVSDLAETKSGLENQNSRLQLEYHGLLGEVAQMKSQLMSHASCQDSIIDKWIQNEARRFVDGQGNQVSQNASVDGNAHTRRLSTTPGVPLMGMQRHKRYASMSSQRDSLAYSDGKLGLSCA